MPIRAEMKKKYPPRKEWKRIRDRILERAGNACECRGECDRAHAGGRCGAPNLTQVERRVGNITGRGKLVSWRLHEHHTVCLGERCDAVLVVLTTAHLDHDPTNNDDENLRAFCQLCHLRYDRHEHARNAAATRAKNRDAKTGQGSLLP